MDSRIKNVLLSAKAIIMSQSNSSNVLTLLLLIVIAANPWVLKVAFSNLLTFLLWIVGILAVFALIGYVIDLIRFDKNTEGEKIKSTKMEMLGKVSFMIGMVLTPVIYFNEESELVYVSLFLIIAPGVFFTLSEQGYFSKQPANIPLKATLPLEDDFSTFRVFKLLAYCLIPFSLMVFFMWWA